MYADPFKYLNSEPENRHHVSRYLPKNKFIYRFSDKKLIFDALQDADGVPLRAGGTGSVKKSLHNYVQI